MGFYLRRQAIGPQHVVEIDEARYESLKQARQTLVDAGAFEQRYELLLGNFMAFEMFCARTSLQSSLTLDFRYGTWATVLAEANRHAINFLTTARQYADHVVRDFSHVSLAEPFKISAERMLSEAYDGNLCYRLVWELRNCVQHRSIAVHGLRGRTKSDPWSEACMLYFQKQRIQEDRGKFKRHVLAELDEQVDLLLMFRLYMAVISRVQVGLRKLIAAPALAARGLVENAIADFSAAQVAATHGGERAVGLVACRGDGPPFEDLIPLVLEWDDVRVELSRKNSRIVRAE